MSEDTVSSRRERKRIFYWRNAFIGLLVTELAARLVTKSTSCIGKRDTLRQDMFTTWLPTGMIRRRSARRSAHTRFDVVYDIVYDWEHGTTGQQVEATAQIFDGRFAVMFSCRALRLTATG